MDRSLALFALLAGVLTVTVSFGDASISPAPPGASPGAPACQIMDREVENLYRASVTVIPESRFEDYGESGIVEIRGDWGFAYFRDVLMADADLRLDFGADLMLRSAGVQLPDQLVRVALDAGLTWRYMSGVSAQVRIKPGVYSDLEEISGKALFLPFSGSLTYALNPSLSGRAGLEVRPGFERSVCPVAYLTWALAPECRVTVGFPRTRATWFVSDIWEFHVAADWRSDSYALREKGSFDRERITLEDYRLYVGGSYGVSDELRVFADIGRVVQRDVEFAENAEGLEDDLDVSSALMIRVGLAGPF